MRISQRMQAKQSQKLHMSPQVQQSILVLHRILESEETGC